MIFIARSIGDVASTQAGFGGRQHSWNSHPYSWHRDAAYSKWRKLFGNVGKSELLEFKEFVKENAWLKRIAADLELDKLILKEGPDYLRPKA